MPSRDRVWTLLLLRGGGGKLFEWKGRRRVAAAVLAGVALAVAAAGAGAGLAWAEHREDRRVAELRERVRQLRQEREQVGRLAARLDSMEREYRQIRRVMAAGADGSESDVGLPEVPGSPGSEATADAGGDAAADPSDGTPGWAWPLSQEGFVTRVHREGRSEDSDRHSGLDIAVPMGSYVRAARAGQVEAAGEDPVYGLFVRLRHADGYRSLYGHNRWLFVQDGDSVTEGEVIALSGSSGRSTAPHLHFEVTGDEGSVDPERLLEGGAPRATSPARDTRGDGP